MLVNELLVCLAEEYFAWQIIILLSKIILLSNLPNKQNISGGEGSARQTFLQQYSGVAISYLSGVAVSYHPHTAGSSLWQKRFVLQRFRRLPN